MPTSREPFDLDRTSELFSSFCSFSAHQVRAMLYCSCRALARPKSSIAAGETSNLAHWGHFRKEEAYKEFFLSLKRSGNAMHETASINNCFKLGLKQLFFFR